MEFRDRVKETTKKHLIAYHVDTPNPTLQELYAKAMLKWGLDSQRDLTFEEMGELITAMCQFARGRVDHLAVVNELVDVSLMIEQMRLIFDKTGLDFERIKAEKIKRLEELLESPQAGQAEV